MSFSEPSLDWKTGRDWRPHVDYIAYTSLTMELTQPEGRKYMCFSSRTKHKRNSHADAHVKKE